MREWLIRKIAFPLAEKYLQNKFYQYYRELDKTQWQTPAEIRERQREKLRLLIRHAYDNVPFYREIFDRKKLRPEDIRGEADLPKFPVVTKEDFRRNFPGRCVAGNLPRSAWILNSTSGSTGNPFQFAMSKDFVGSKYARYLRGLDWCHIGLTDRYLRVWGVHRFRFGERPFRKHVLSFYELSAFDMDDRPPEFYADYIRRFRPVALEAYTSAVVKLARLLKGAGIGDVRVKSILVSAENLTATDRKLLEEVFGAQVFDRYGSRECGAIAQECDRHQGLHLNAESFIMEFVASGDSRDDTMGKKIVITNLDNYAMPFIRYEIGDRGEPEGTVCACGRGLPLIRKIAGRETDFLYLPSGRMVPFLFFNYFFEQYGSRIRNFKVVAKDDRHWQVLIVPTEKFNAETGEAIISGMRQALNNEVTIELVAVEKIPLAKTGKQVIVEKGEGCRRS